MSNVLNAPSGAPKEVPLGGGCGSGNCACKSQAQAQQRAPHSFFDDTDYGTPARHADVDVTLEIDGQAVTVPAGTSVMRAAAEAGVNVPKLCATDSLEPFGSCRLCLVEIEGKRGYPASCTTPVEAGMKVRTQTDRLQSLRRNVMELYISDHPLDCLTCPANGDCELQDMAGVTGLREVRYGFDGANHLKDKKDESNPYFTYARRPRRARVRRHAARIAV
jgi:formate dehydrogenase major subunit